MWQETHYLIRPAGTTFEEEHCVSRWNVYILQKMIHGPSNVKFVAYVWEAAPFSA